MAEWPPEWERGAMSLNDQIVELTNHLKLCIAMLSTVLKALDDHTQSHAGERGDMTHQGGEPE
jgi:hypothetical protein